MSSNGALRTVPALVPSGNFIGTSTADVRIPLIVRSGNRVLPGMLDPFRLRSSRALRIPARAFIPSAGDPMSGRLSNKTYL